MFKEITSFAIRYSGIPFFIRNICARNKVCILIYHSPEPDVLDKHLNYLSKKYKFITLTSLVDAIYEKKWAKVSPKGLLITLDDGDKNNFKLLEVFKKYKVTPTIYICSQIVNTNRKYWFKVIKGKEFDEIIKYSNTKILKTLKENYSFTLTSEYSEQERQALKRKEIMLMKSFVDFQSHSRFHPILTTCIDKECKKEIFQSKKDIETLLANKCKHFSYPNGNYGPREMAYVKDAGYLSARTVDFGWNDLNTNPYKLKSISVTDDASINLLSAQVSGMTVFLRYIAKIMKRE